MTANATANPAENPPTARSTAVLERITDAQAVVLDRLDQARIPAVDLATRAVQIANRVVPIGTARRARVAPRLGEALDRQYAFALELLTRQRAVTRDLVNAAGSTGTDSGATATPESNGS